MIETLNHVGWSIFSRYGVFSHGLGDEYYTSSKWVSLERQEFTIYVEREGAEQVLATVCLFHPEVIGDLHILKIYRNKRGLNVVNPPLC